jgi:hypothetical protein
MISRFVWLLPFQSFGLFFKGSCFSVAGPCTATRYTHPYCSKIDCDGLRYFVERQGDEVHGTRLAVMMACTVDVCILQDPES